MRIGIASRGYELHHTGRASFEMCEKDCALLFIIPSLPFGDRRELAKVIFDITSAVVT